MNPKALKKRRAELELTQQQVADRASIRQQHYARLETGERDNLTFETAERIADALETTLDALRLKPKRARKK